MSHAKSKPKSRVSTAQALGAKLTAAIKSYLLHDASFKAALWDDHAPFERGIVYEVRRTAEGANEVRVRRGGQSRADRGWYPVYDAFYVPQRNDDILLLRIGRTTGYCVIGVRGGGRTGNWTVALPGGSLRKYKTVVDATGALTRLLIAEHDSSHNEALYGTLQDDGSPPIAESDPFDGNVGVQAGNRGTPGRVLHYRDGRGHSKHVGSLYHGVSRIDPKTGRPTNILGQSSFATYASRVYDAAGRIVRGVNLGDGHGERHVSVHTVAGTETGITEYVDDGSGHTVLVHTRNLFGHTLPHGHSLFDDGTGASPVALGGPSTPPVLTPVYNPGAFAPGVTVAVAYTFYNGTGESTPSPRTILTLSDFSALDMDSITVPSGITGIRLYVSPAPGVTTGLKKYGVDLVAVSSVVPAQTILGYGDTGAATAPTANSLFLPGRVTLSHGDPVDVLSGGYDTTTHHFDTRVGVDPVWATGAGAPHPYFDFQDNCITFPMGQVLCGDALGGSGGGGGSSGPTALEFLIDGGGQVITTGVQGRLVVPSDCTITAAELLADQSGSIAVDIWKCTYAGYPPTSAYSICAAALPTISGAQKSQDPTLTGWTTLLHAGDILVFNVNSVSTIQQCSLALTVSGAGGSGGGGGGGSGSSTPVAVRAYSTVDDTTIANNGFLLIPFEHTEFDQGTASPQHSNTSTPEQLTCQVAGVYQVTAQFAVDSTSTVGAGPIQVRLLHTDLASNEDIIGEQEMFLKNISGLSYTMVTMVTGLCKMAVGDTVTLGVHNFTGLTITLRATLSTDPTRRPYLGWMEAGGGGAGALPIASSTILGGVKIGTGISEASDGTISVTGGGGGGGGALTIVQMTGNLTLTQANVFVVCTDAAQTAGATLTLPPAHLWTGQWVHTMSPTRGSPLVVAQSPDLLVGSTCSIQVLSDGVNWYGMDC